MGGGLIGIVVVLVVAFLGRGMLGGDGGGTGIDMGDILGQILGQVLGVLHTGHCIVRVSPDGATSQRSGVASTIVHFGEVSDAEIDAYVATGEPLRVAGAFTIDGLGGPFIDGIEGDPHTVVGISLPLLRRLLAELGVGWTTLWSPASS